MMPNFKNALIVGAGAGLSASLAHLFHAQGIGIALASRTPDKVKDLATALGAERFACNVADQDQVASLFSELDRLDRQPDLVVFNPSARQRGPILDLDPDLVAQAVNVTAMGGFHVAQEAVRRMLPAGQEQGHGAILFTGASASIKGFAHSAPFAMGKFALRGLAQSLARELHPKGIHIGHFIIDGGIRNPERPERIDPADNPDSMLDPDAIARAYWHLAQQDRSAWTWEVELRPWVERF